MGDATCRLWNNLQTLMPVNVIVNILDVLFVWFVIYKLITLIKGTKAVQLLKGIFVIVIAKSCYRLFWFEYAWVGCWIK